MGAQKPTKILVVTDNYPPRVGGMANVAHQFCRSFPPGCISVVAPAGRGWTIWDVGDNASARAFDQAQPYKTRRILYWGFSGSGPLTFLAVFYLALRALWAYWRDGCSIIFLGKTWPICLAAPLFKCFGIPCVAYCHGSEIMWAFSPLKARLRLKAMRALNFMIANSAYTRDYLVRMGIDAPKTAIIHPKVDASRFEAPVDVDTFKKQEGLTGKRILLTVGRLMERKGQRQVIRALPAILDKHPDLVYIALGVGPDLDFLRNLAQECGVAEHTLFPGNRNTVEFMHACEIFIMPSLDFSDRADIESFGIVFLEANICGKPVIGGRNCGMLDAVAEGESGLLVDPLDLNQIATAVNRLLDDPPLASRLGQQGRDRARRLFNANRYAPEFNTHILGPLGLEIPCLREETQPDA